MTLESWLQNILKQRLLESRKKNSGISLRAFSKNLDVPVSTVSLLLNGKRKVSHRLADKLAKNLRLDPMESCILKEFSVQLKQKPVASKSKSLSPHEKSQALEETHQPTILKLSPEQYEKLSNWHYLAIVNLVKTIDFKTDPEWIAHRLGIGVATAREAIDYLLATKMIVIDVQGKASRGYDQLRTTDRIPNQTIRKSHEQSLTLAKKAMQERDFEDCDFTSLFLPVDFSRLDEMRLKLRNFQQEFMKEYAYDSKATEVVRFSFQLYPVTQARKPA